MGESAKGSVRRRIAALAIGASMLGVLAGVVPSQAGPHPVGQIISIPGNSAFVFATARVVITKGSQVKYTNLDIVPHNVYFDTLGFGTANLGLAQSQVLAKTATLKPGTYNFHCTLHHPMKGALIVK